MTRSNLSGSLSTSSTALAPVCSQLTIAETREDLPFHFEQRRIVINEEHMFGTGRQLPFRALAVSVLSWAIPPARVPSASIFWAWRRWSWAFCLSRVSFFSLSYTCFNSNVLSLTLFPVRHSLSQAFEKGLLGFGQTGFYKSPVNQVKRHDLKEMPIQFVMPNGSV